MAVKMIGAKNFTKYYVVGRLNNVSEALIKTSYIKFVLYNTNRAKLIFTGDLHICLVDIVVNK